MKKKDDRGYTLVELVAVIAIMAILVGVTSISVAILSGKQAKQTRDEVKAKLETIRIQTMGKRTVTAKLSADASGGYVLLVTSTMDASKEPEVTSYALGGSSCQVYYSCQKDSVYTEGGEDLIPVTADGLTLEFDRASGAMKEITLADGSSSRIYHLFVVQGKKVYGICFYPETGQMEEE
jgi:prepilin-type N-terminal cleavage/methylation domain-containing protein